jgi:hypothetical protein
MNCKKCGGVILRCAKCGTVFCYRCDNQGSTNCPRCGWFSA